MANISIYLNKGSNPDPPNARTENRALALSTSVSALSKLVLAVHAHILQLGKVLEV